MHDALFQAPADPDTLRIIPLGGCGEFGMNLTCYLFRGRLYVVDAGVRFPDPTRLGTDAVIPDVDPLFAQTGGVFAYLITHGHEDHIGALPYLIRKWPAPIYATRWTAELIRNKFNRHGISNETHPVTVVDPGDRVATEGFDVEYFQVNHSIPHACAFFIRTPALNVFHTGDFKYDAQPLIEPPMNLERLSAFGDEGVDFMLADSTNAEKTGFCPGEASVLEPLRQVFAAATGAVFVTTFSSNLWRLKTIAEACVATGRRLFVTGGGIEQTLAVAKTLGVYELPPLLRIEESTLRGTPRASVCVLATGCQGEWRSAMARIASGEHKLLGIEPDDTVVFSSRVIPGNERYLIAMVDGLRRQGARIVTARENPGIHVSGHAYGGELELLRRRLRPRIYTPMHGGYAQLDANLRSAHGESQAGHLIETGDVFDVRRGGLKVVGRIAVDVCYVDAESRVVMSYETLRERLRIGDLGAALLTGVYVKSERSWLVPPEVSFQGLKLPDSVDPAGFALSAATATRQRTAAMLHVANGTAASDEEVLEELRIILRRQLFQVLKKKPVVIVKLHLV